MHISTTFVEKKVEGRARLSTIIYLAKKVLLTGCLEQHRYKTHTTRPTFNKQYSA